MVSDFFYKESKSKKKNFLRWGEDGLGNRFFFTKKPNLKIKRKKKYMFCFLCWGGGGK